MHAIESCPAPFEAAAPALEGRRGRYTPLLKLPAGLRAEVWVGLPAGAVHLDELVIIKHFFPHAPGRLLAALTEELTLASRLTHSNVVRTRAVGRAAGRYIAVAEYHEGVTLRALLRRVSVARRRLDVVTVTRLLLALVRAVQYAERRAASTAARQLVQQVVAADDVLVTFDGGAKVLGFKARLGGCSEGLAGGERTFVDSTAHAAVDALLSEHLTPELAAVLSREGRQGAWRLASRLERWQQQVLGSDGRHELSALMAELFPAARLAQRAQLEDRLEQWSRGEGAEQPLAVSGFEEAAEEEAPPASGYRRRAVAGGRTRAALG